MVATPVSARLGGRDEPAIMPQASGLFGVQFGLWCGAQGLPWLQVGLYTNLVMRTRR